MMFSNRCVGILIAISCALAILCAPISVSAENNDAPTVIQLWTTDHSFTREDGLCSWDEETKTLTVNDGNILRFEIYFNESANDCTIDVAGDMEIGHDKTKLSPAIYMRNYTAVDANLKITGSGMLKICNIEGCGITHSSDNTVNVAFENLNKMIFTNINSSAIDVQGSVSFKKSIVEFERSPDTFRGAAGLILADGGIYSDKSPSGPEMKFFDGTDLTDSKEINWNNDGSVKAIKTNKPVYFGEEYPTNSNSSSNWESIIFVGLIVLLILVAAAIFVIGYVAKKKKKNKSR